ncbi:MAG TPA: CocE/NonD family hydrolase, partial [Acidimicrobiales bacterium]|nr:CocE/NonD family hydrolase [Acidimicrobiales bacterium]
MTDSPFSVRGSVLQVSVTGPAGTPVQLRDADGTVVRSGAIDHFGDRLTLADLGVTDGLKGLGGLVFRHLDPGPYTLDLDGEEVAVGVLDPFVLPDDFDERVRGQRLDAGYGYVEVRDGALLSLNVCFPDRAEWGDGPYPTLVQYSGYKDSKPDFATGDPADENVLNTEANLARHCGYAVVGVAIRGSAGSEGSFLLLEPIQGTDGHDVIEAVAAQPWVARKADGSPKVGMIGRSMPGYEQLLVASYNPPSLAAVTPAAVGGRPYGAAGRPGGVPNVALARGIAGWQVDPVDPPGGVPQVQPPRYE